MLTTFLQRTLTLLACGISLLFAYMNTFPPTTNAPATPPTPTTLLTAVLSGLIFSTVILALPIILKLLTTPNLFRTWFSLPKFTLKKSFIGLGIFLILYLFTYLIYCVLDPADVQNNLSFILLLPEAPKGLIFAIGLFICVLFPLAEELLYRGIILRSFPPCVGLLASTLLFALAHGINGYLYPILFIGWGFGLLALRTRSILPTFLCHAAFNTLNFIFLFI